MFIRNCGKRALTIWYRFRAGDILVDEDELLRGRALCKLSDAENENDLFGCTKEGERSSSCRFKPHFEKLITNCTFTRPFPLLSLEKLEMVR